MRTRFKLITLLTALVIIFVSGALYLRRHLEARREALARAYVELAIMSRWQAPLGTCESTRVMRDCLRSATGRSYLARLDQVSEAVCFDEEEHTLYHLHVKGRDPGRNDPWCLATVTVDPAGRNEETHAEFPSSFRFTSIQRKGPSVALEFFVPEDERVTSLIAGGTYEARFPPGQAPSNPEALHKIARLKFNEYLRR